jgi:hypothetical protein
VSHAAAPETRNQRINRDFECKGTTDNTQNPSKKQAYNFLSFLVLNINILEERSESNEDCNSRLSLPYGNVWQKMSLLWKNGLQRLQRH